MDTGSSSASIGNEELDLPKFVAFKSLSNEHYLYPDPRSNNITSKDVEPISWGVKHEVQKAKCGGGLVHIRCCDTNKYWCWCSSWRWPDPNTSEGTMIAADVDRPEEDKSARACTLIKPSQCTKEGVSIVKFQLMKEGEWCSVGRGNKGLLEAGNEDHFIVIDWASIVYEKMDLPNFAVFQSLSNKNYVRPHKMGYFHCMKFDVDDVVRWGVKHKIQKAKYADGLVHIRCCDTDKYWCLDGLSKKIKVGTTYHPQEDSRMEDCTLFKPNHDTKGSVKLEVMSEGKWWPIGVDDEGYLVKDGNECFIISNWESFEANQPQKPSSGAKNADTGGSGASNENEELDLPKFVAINSLMNKRYLIGSDGYYIKLEGVDIESSSIKHEVQKAKCDRELIHIKCCETGLYWSWGGHDSKWVVVEADEPEEDKNTKTCSLIKPTQHIKDGVCVVNLQILFEGTWYSIGGDGDGFLLATGGEDFIVSNWETLQMGLISGPHGGCAAKSITAQLSRENYFKWRQEMLKLLLSEELTGYVDGTIKPVQEEGDSLYEEWKRNDGLVRGWILATLTETIHRQVMKFVTAREVWMELKKIFISTFQLSFAEVIDLNDKKRGNIVSKYVELHKAILKGSWETAAEFMNNHEEAVGQPITSIIPFS